MKIKTELEIKVEMGVGSRIGTGCQGYLPKSARYEDVVFVFGEPQLGASQDGKIKVEWIGRINGLSFTIYDYKSKLAPERNTDWHIGGKHRFVADLVNLYFQAH